MAEEREDGKSYKTELLITTYYMVIRPISRAKEGGKK
jgi:hypothetical protein